MLFSRHNGIGDIIATLPFVHHLMSLGYRVHYATDLRNHRWLAQVLPGLTLQALDSDPYTDYRQVRQGYEAYVNFNRFEEMDEYLAERGEHPLNFQVLLAHTVLSRGLAVPASLAPSDVLGCRVYPPEGVIYIFTQATDRSRELHAEVAESVGTALRCRYWQQSVQIDPVFPSREDLVREIGKADLVIAGDTGPIHVAELMNVNWFCFHTSMSGQSRHQYYKKGRWIESGAPCSPCGRHGCVKGVVVCNNQFNMDRALAEIGVLLQGK